MGFWDFFKSRGIKNTAGGDMRKFSMHDYDHIPVESHHTGWESDYISTSNSWNDYNKMRGGMWRPGEMSDIRRMGDLDRIICRQSSASAIKPYALEATKLMKKVMNG